MSMCVRMIPMQLKFEIRLLQFQSAIDSNRRRPLKAQVETILEELSSTSLSRGEQQAVREHANAVLAKIDQHHQEGEAA